MSKFIDLTTRQIGNWSVIGPVPDVRPIRWKCVCICGVERNVLSGSLTKGASTGCGCTRKRPTTHGHARRSSKTRTYLQWKAMRSRCSQHSADRANYYDRGISVCERWNDYSSFLEDMGDSKGLTLDRKDNNKGYSPENCRWADMAQQRINQRRISWVMLNGKRMHVQDAAIALGVKPSAIWNDKRRNGGSPQDAVDRVAARNGHR